MYYSVPTGSVSLTIRNLSWVILWKDRHLKSFNKIAVLHINHCFIRPKSFKVLENAQGNKIEIQKQLS